MLKISRYLALLLLGAILGLGILGIIGGSSGAKTGPVVTNGGPIARSGSAKDNATPTAQPGPRSAQIAAPPTAKLTAPASLGTEYIALGDSVAYGVGAPNPTEGGYAGLFYANYLKRIQPDLLTYRNLAVPGETSATFLNPTKGKSQMQRALDELGAAQEAGRRVSPLSLTIGGNDMLNLRGKPNADRETGLARFEANLNRILDELKAKVANTDLLLTTYYNPYAYQTGGEDAESAWVQRFNDTIRKVGLAHRARIADFFGPLVGHERDDTWIGVGDVHPKPAGHAIMAQALWKATGYDGQSPALALTYSPLGPDGQVSSSGRLIFKVSAQDEWAATVFKVAGSDPENAGAGSISTAWARIDDGTKSSLTSVPPRFSQSGPGAQEYSFVVDAGALAIGRHTVRFEASDAAGNVGSVELNFEIT